MAGKAAMPPKGWVAPAPLSRDGLTLTVWPEDAAPSGFVVDARDWPGPVRMRKEILRGFEVLAGPNGRWHRVATIQGNVTRARRWLRWVDDWSDPNLPATAVQPQRLAQLTPGVWAAWVTRCNGQGLNAGKRVALSTGALLRACPDLPVRLHGVVKARKGGITRGPVTFAEPPAFRELRSAARRAVRAAHKRITANYDLALRADSPDLTGPDRRRAEVLQDMLVNVRPASRDDYRAVGAAKRLTHWNTARQARDVSYKVQKAQAQSLLFPDLWEALACVVALTCIRGLNLTPVLTVDVPDRGQDPAGQSAQLNIDKPRRGSTQRFYPEIFEDTGPGSDGELLRMIEELTEPVRHHLRLTGAPSSRLILYVNEHGSVRSGIPEPSLRPSAPWLPAGLRIDFRQIKRTYEVRVARESTGNTESTHTDVYVLSDPKVVERERRRAQKSIERAKTRAMKEVGLRFLPGDDPRAAAVPEKKDTIFASCLDVLDRLGKGDPCLDSFLLCLLCPNAVATPRHLPRMLAVRDSMDELRTAYPPDLWHAKFEAHYYRLDGIIQANSTPAERQSARRKVTDADRELIRQALTTRSPS